jgi:adenine phosphoribosyltransferase
MDLTDELIDQIDWIGGHANVWRAFADPGLFPRLVAALTEPFHETGVTRVAGIEARGFILGAAVAAELGVGFTAIRKDGGLLPGPKHSAMTTPDYRGRSIRLRLQQGDLSAADAVALVDDWFETGSQPLTAISLIEMAGARYAGSSIIVDQLTSEARGRLEPLHALLRHDQLLSVD